MGEDWGVRREWWIWLGLGMLTLAVYWPVTGSGFINFDDPAYVTDNPPVEAGLTLNGLVWALTTGHSSNWHPLTWLSHMADCQWYGLDAGKHHLTSLLFHVANTLLVFGWLRSMTGAVWRSALVAALFAWHPLHVESVAWISERKDVLSTFFCLLTLLTYGRYAREAKGSSKSKLYYSLALVFFALGLMSKPMLVTLPLVLLLLDFWPLERGFKFQVSGSKLKPKSGAQDLTWGALVVEKLPFLLLAAGSSVVTYLVQRAGGAVIPVEALSVGERVANAVVSYARYLGKTVWPEGLAMYYPTVKDWGWWQVLGALLLMVGVSVWVWRERQRRPYLMVGWLWYVGTLVPVIGVVQVGAQAMADRYAYIPLLGIFIMAVWGLGDLIGKRQSLKPLAWGLAVPVLVACLVLTGFQVRTWKNAIVLCRHTLAVTFKNARIENLLGLALMKENDLDEAGLHFQKAVDYQPDYADAHGNLGRILLKKGDAKDAAAQLRYAVQRRSGDPYLQNDAGTAYLQNGQLDDALTCFRAAVQIEPDFMPARNNLGLALAGKGQVDEAIACFEDALKIQPNDIQILNSLSQQYIKKGSLNDAIVLLEKAIETDPADALSQDNLGAALLQKGNMDEAVLHFQKALQIRPDYVPALSNLGVVLLRQGRLDDAIADFQKALQLQPGYSRAIDNLARIAWVLATCPDASVRNGTKALELAQQMESASKSENPMAIGTLAAAYAETGRFTDAVAAAERALRLANTGTNAAVTALLETQLKSYQANQPFRDNSQARPGASR